MAPPNIRTTSNRRAQLGVFAGYVIAGIGAVIGAALLIISLWQPQALAGLRAMATDATSSVGSAGASARVGSKNFLEAIRGYYQAGSRNAELEREMKIARVKQAEAEALRQENNRLKGTLGLLEGETRPVAVARLIGSTSSSARRFAYLSAGRTDGLEPEMPIVSPMGLVGRVLETGRTSSRIMLLTDAESMVPVRRSDDDVVAFAEGRPDGSLRIRLINLGINPLKVGDIFVTSGAGGIFRPNIPVAVVAGITKDGAVANLLSNPAATDYVSVEPVWKPEAVQLLRSPEQPPADPE
ncbi:rod shape-determining protein MreC [Tsuneonella sp. HG222]